MAWLLAKAQDAVKKAQDQFDQLQEGEFLQKLQEVDLVQKARDAAKDVAKAASQVSESVQAEYRRTFEELDCQIFHLQPELMIMEYPSLQTIERLAKRLNESHAQKMMILNLSEEQYDGSKFHGEVMDVPLYGLELPPLTALVQLCLTAQQWLTQAEHVLVVHGAPGSYSRAVAFASCLLSFQGATAKEALKEALRPFPATQLWPSQQRCLGYFVQSLEAPVPPQRLCLARAMMSGVPSFEAEGSAAFRPVVEVWCGEHFIYSSFKGGQGEAVWPGSYAATDAVVSLPVPSEPLAGDVLLKVYHLYLSGSRDLALKLFFHTSFIKEGLQVPKAELDLEEDRFGEDFFVDLAFTEVPKNEDSAQEEEKAQQREAAEAELLALGRAKAQELRQLRQLRQEPRAAPPAGEEDLEALEATLMGAHANGGPEESSGRSEEQEPKPEEEPKKEKAEKPAAAASAAGAAAGAAEIEDLFSEFDAVLSSGGAASAPAPAPKGGYEEKKDMLAEVDDFLKELDDGTK